MALRTTVTFVGVSLSAETPLQWIKQIKASTLQSVIPEIAYPLEAVREIVLNMIVHRDYRASADAAIKIFHDRMEFFNPGQLPEGMSLEQIISGSYDSSPRNKQIAALFKEAGIIEKYGSGIKRVQQAMRSLGAKDPEFELIGNTFKVTLYPMDSKAGEGVNEGVNGGVKGGVNSLLTLIRENEGKRTPFFASALQTSEKNIERWLKHLKKKGAVEFRDAPKSGGYHIIHDQKLIN